MVTFFLTLGGSVSKYVCYLHVIYFVNISYQYIMKILKQLYKTV